MQNIKSTKVGSTIIPMEVTDVVDNYYILKSQDRTKEYKMQVGLLDNMENGLLVPVGDNTYIQLIIPEDEQDFEQEPYTRTADEDNNILDASGYHLHRETLVCEENIVSDNTLSDLENTTSQNFQNTEDRHTWTYDQTICLIDSMGSHIDELNHPKKRRFVFNNISNDLLSSGFSINASTCQNKWKNLLRSYKVAKDIKNKTGRGPSRFHFFDKMDDLLGEKPSNKCSYSLESSDLNNLEDGFTPGVEVPPSFTAADESQPEPPKKRAKCNNAINRDFVTLKKDEYQRKQQRHDEKIDLEKQKLDVEKEKVNLLRQLLNIS